MSTINEPTAEVAAALSADKGAASPKIVPPEAASPDAGILHPRVLRLLLEATGITLTFERHLPFHAPFISPLITDVPYRSALIKLAPGAARSTLRVTNVQDGISFGTGEPTAMFLAAQGANSTLTDAKGTQWRRYGPNDDNAAMGAMARTHPRALELVNSTLVYPLGALYSLLGYTCHPAPHGAFIHHAGNYTEAEYAASNFVVDHAGFNVAFVTPAQWATISSGAAVPQGWDNHPVVFLPNALTDDATIAAAVSVMVSLRAPEVIFSVVHAGATTTLHSRSPGYALLRSCSDTPEVIVVDLNGVSHGHADLFDGAFAARQLGANIITEAAMQNLASYLEDFVTEDEWVGACLLAGACTMHLTSAGGDLETCNRLSVYRPPSVNFGLRCSPDTIFRGSNWCHHHLAFGPETISWLGCCFQFLQQHAGYRASAPDKTVRRFESGSDMVSRSIALLYADEFNSNFRRYGLLAPRIEDDATAPEAWPITIPMDWYDGTSIDFGEPDCNLVPTHELVYTGGYGNVAFRMGSRAENPFSPDSRRRWSWMSICYLTNAGVVNDDFALLRAANGTYGAITTAGLHGFDAATGDARANVDGPRLPRCLPIAPNAPTAPEEIIANGAVVIMRWNYSGWSSTLKHGRTGGVGGPYDGMVRTHAYQLDALVKDLSADFAAFSAFRGH